MKPLGSVGRGLSRTGSLAGRFLLAPATLLFLAPEGPTAAYYCCRADGVEGEGLEVPA